MKTLIERIKALCKERGITLKDLEDGAGITQNTMGRWGENTPSVDKVKRVADFLGVSVDDLLREPEETDTATSA